MIRAFKPDDLDALTTLWLEGNLDAHSFIPPTYWRDYVPMFKELLPQATVYVYEADGAILGFAGLQATYIAGIFVRKDARGHGVGKALLQAIKRDHACLTLSVYAKNTRALRFYERAGFYRIETSVDPDTGETEYTLQAAT